MKLPFRPRLALLLGALATAVTSCDYAPYSPGKNPQAKEDFANPPGYTSADVNADSISTRQTVYKPTGKGSATALKNGTVQDQLTSAPAGGSTASPQNASGKLGPVNQADPTNAARTAPKK